MDRVTNLIQAFSSFGVELKASLLSVTNTQVTFRLHEKLDTYIEFQRERVTIYKHRNHEVIRMHHVHALESDDWVLKKMEALSDVARTVIEEGKALEEKERQDTAFLLYD